MASTPTPSPLPGESPPPAVITNTDKSGLILIITAMCLAFVLVSILIRAYVRHGFSPKLFAWDDGLAIGATFMCVVQNAVVFYEADQGLGKIKSDISAHELVAIQKAMYADDIFYIITVWLTKLSVAALLLRLSPKRSHIFVCQVTIGLIILTAVVSIAIVSLKCNLSHPWIFINSENARCVGIFTRWQVVAAFDSSLEVIIFFMTIFMIYSLQMVIYKKLSILFVFGLRLVVIVPAILRLHHLWIEFNSSDATKDAFVAVLCKQIEISYAVIAATIPCLRPFMTAIATNYGAPAEGFRTKIEFTGDAYQSLNTRSTKSLNTKLRGLASKLGSASSDQSRSNARSALHSRGAATGPFEMPTTNNNATGTPRSNDDSLSVENADCQQMVIMKDITYKVEDENMPRNEPGQLV